MEEAPRAASAGMMGNVSTEARLPRKKGPKPKRVRRIILKPLKPEEEDALLAQIERTVEGREDRHHTDPVLARMRRKLALRQVHSAADLLN